VQFAKTLFLAVAVSLAVGRPAAAGTIFVKFNAAGANNGTTWANAYTDLRSAITAAVATDEIWVAAGTYKPTATTDRTMSFPLKNGVGIYGGFAGTETMRSQANPDANVTTLSGDIGTVNVASDNSYHVVTSDNTVTSTGILDGFTISVGRATAPRIRPTAAGAPTSTVEARRFHAARSRATTPSTGAPESGWLPAAPRSPAAGGC